MRNAPNSPDDKTAIVNLSRRHFLRTGTAALTLGGYVLYAGAESLKAGPGSAGTTAEGAFAPNAFLRIGADDGVTVIAKHIEFGQGSHTGLATLVAEELDADWSQIRVEAAPADASRYNNLNWGPVQGTGGSTAMANSYEQMRKAGAAARAMLVQAAAAQWGVPAAEITVARGVVTHADSNRTARFGELAAAAAEQPVPESPELKQPDAFTLIGKSLPRKDIPPKIDGSAIFTQDLTLPDMRVAVVAHPRRFGARVKGFDAKAAREVAGVEAVFEVPGGVAVVARDFWTADQGRKKLRIEWDESQAFKQGSAEIIESFRETARTPGMVAQNTGDTDQAIADATRVVKADYEFPYLAHAAMEPMNCIARVTNDGCEIWNGAQLHTGDKMAVAQALELEPARVKIHTLFAGGSFGRRASKDADYVIESVLVAKQFGGGKPVKLVWSREDDMRAGYYRPLNFHALEAGLDADGNITAWRHRIVGQSIMAGTGFADFAIKDGIDATSVEGARNLPYAIPNLRVELHSPEVAVPVLWWRSVGHTHTAYSTETFLDQLAAASGKDPAALRRSLLAGQPRYLGVLDRALKESGWGQPLPEGRGRGVAVHKSFESFVAEVAEVTVDGGEFRVDKVTIAVDCGIAINPDNIVAQMEGGMGYGLSAALASEITLKDGKVQQGNFDGYQVLRMDQMPQVDVHIIASNAAPTGVGEPGTPPIAPAVANALAAVTGERYHRLPIKLSA